MIIKRSKATSTSSKKSSSFSKNVRTGTELLVVTNNELGSFAKLASALSKSKVSIECFTGYVWGSEAAFRIVTSDNKKASSVINAQGYSVTESPVVLWYTNNETSRISLASEALAKANISTYSTYSCSASDAPKNTNTVVAFNTSDPASTASIISHLG